MKRLDKKPSTSKYTYKEWLASIVILIGFVGFWGAFGLFVYNQSKDSKPLHAASQVCEAKGGDFRVYFDDVRGKRTPVCRLPITAEEHRRIDESNAYYEGLRNGDIDPDEGDLSGFQEYPN